MPPHRTFTPVKPVKTERTHEENQERAYIAASRRSDRSLEARVESARRASDIHKRRTGRSLRVTEQDVINEEMYEEEDDGLPRHFRALTAHLQTNSPELDRRVQAIIASQVGMRDAWQAAQTGNYSNLYPNAPQFANNSNPMFPSPLQTQGFSNYQGQPAMQSPSSASPHTPNRFAPYPMPGNAQYRPQQQQRPQSQRAMSIQMPPRAFPQLPPGQYMSPVPNNPNTQLIHPAPISSRRASVPVVTDVTTPDSLQSSPVIKSENASPKTAGSPSKPLSAPATILMPQASLASQDQAQSQQQTMQAWQNGPFSMALPLESQQMMNPSCIPQNAFGAALMSHPSHAPDFDLNSFGLEDFGPSDPGSMLKPGANFYANQSGMNMTLAPEQMLKSSNGNATTTSMGGQNMGAFDGAALTPGQDMNNLFNFDSRVPSAAGTPGVSNNDSFGDFYNWGDSTT